MKVDRVDLLNRLLSIEPGISKRGDIQQSSCVVLFNGRFFSMQAEISCSIISGLDSEMIGAVRAEKFIELLKRMPEEEIDVSIESKTLFLKGKGRKLTKLVMEEDILLPVNEVEKPKKHDWIGLSADFTEAVAVTAKCCSRRREDDFAKKCVHIHPRWLEACDNIRLCRFPTGSMVGSSVLVRGDSIKSIVQLGMTKGQETSNWLHFWNPAGLRVSVRKYESENYPDMSEFLALRGEKISFPPTLEKAAEVAGLFTNDAGDIRITAEEGILTVEGKSEDGEHFEPLRMKGYEGPKLGFFINPKLISELVAKYTQIEITDHSLRVDTGKFILVTGLEVQKDGLYNNRHDGANHSTEG